VDDAKLDTRGIGIFNNGVETCPCPAKKPCYHISLATLYRAKVTARRRREAQRTRREARSLSSDNFVPLMVR